MLNATEKHGVLIKGGTFLEKVGQMTKIAFDKTGTITEGSDFCFRSRCEYGIHLVAFKIN